MFEDGDLFACRRTAALELSQDWPIRVYVTVVNQNLLRSIVTVNLPYREGLAPGLRRGYAKVLAAIACSNIPTALALLRILANVCMLAHSLDSCALPYTHEQNAAALPVPDRHNPTMHTHCTLLYAAPRLISPT
jgi:hypothetical protein